MEVVRHAPLPPPPEILKFRDFKKAFMNFSESIIVHIFAIFKHFTKQTIYSDSRDNVGQNHIQHV